MATKEIDRIPFPKDVKLSDYQLAIKEAWIGQKGNKIIQAVAGSGKTFTTAAMCHLDPDKSPGLYSSFQTAIVSEVAPKLPDHIGAKGAHALGYGACAKSWKRPNPNVGKFKIKNYIEEKLSYMSDKNDPDSYERVSAGVDLISKIKLHMTDPSDFESILQLTETYDIEIDCLTRFFADIGDIIKWNDEVARDGVVDFDDMIYLPVKYDLPVFQYKRVFIDECQDFSPLMQKFMKKLVHPDGKLMAIGDERQSIFGFAGADTGAMANLKNMFNCEEFPLSVCYRCHKLAIQEAQKLVPQIQWHENSIEGELMRYQSDSDKFEWSLIPKEAMILCRRNAPLVRPAFKLLREGRKATIKGRNIGQGLIKTIMQVDKKNHKGTMTGFLDVLYQWKEEKIRQILGRKHVNLALIESTEDQVACIEGFCEGEDDVVPVCAKIKRIFDDNTTDGVILSTAHRSKGLEHDNVFILDCHNIQMRRDGMSEENKQQERNLNYVAVTRPKKFLGFIP